MVKPGADPSQIALHFSGASSVKALKNRINLGTQTGTRSIGDLVVYQNVNGKQKRVAASFSQTGSQTVRFHLGAYDKSKALVIDPVVYGTYYGGDDGFDEVRSVVEDADGGTFITGYTQSIYFPVMYGPYGYNLNGVQNAFVAKLQGDAYAETYAAYIGGSVIDGGQFLKLDAQGTLWVAGQTESSDFPGNTRPNVQYLNGDPLSTGGTFTLSYSGETTNPIPWNATQGQVQSALQQLPALSGNGLNGLPQALVNGSTGPLQNGGTYTVTLNNDRPLILRVNDGGLQPNLTVTPQQPQNNPTGTYLKQIIGQSGSIPTSGTFTLSFTNVPTQTTASTTQTTGPLQYNSTAAEIQAALQGLSNIPQGVTVNVVANNNNFTTIDLTSMTVTFQVNNQPTAQFPLVASFDL